MPVWSRNRRRVGFDCLVMSVARLLIDMSQESGCHDNKPDKPGLSELAAQPTTVTCSGAPSHCRPSAQDKAPRVSLAHLEGPGRGQAPEHPRSITAA
jgi:hypothetical protein